MMLFHSPFKRGKFSDIVHLKRPRVYRQAYKTDVDTINQMNIDLVQTLAEMGFNLKNVYTISRKLVSKGWMKVKKIESS